MPRGRPKKEEKIMSEQLNPNLYVIPDAPVVIRYFPLSKTGTPEGGALPRVLVETLIKEYYDNGYKLRHIEYAGDLPEAVNLLVVFEKVDAS